ncbi:phage tail tube protein [Polaribacter sp.]|uniref:phage tail tube protein n=1 Tax=Polaribacter sp. TaxID=1920175 RepID=UPI0025D28FB2|nr:phage tail tube protein [Polaribacter sp.]
MSLDYSGSMRIKIATKTIMHEVEASLNEARDFEELASKDIVGKDFHPKEGTWSLTGNAIAANSNGDAQIDLQAIVESYQAKTLVAIELTDGVTGNMAYSGNAYIEQYTLTSANEDKAKFDFSLKGVGTLTVAVNT